MRGATMTRRVTHVLFASTSVELASDQPSEVGRRSTQAMRSSGTSSVMTA